MIEVVSVPLREDGSRRRTRSAADVMVFRTSVERVSQVLVLAPQLDHLIRRGGRWSFDLEDRDRVLRVDAPGARSSRIMALLAQHGHRCEDLDAPR